MEIVLAFFFVFIQISFSCFVLEGKKSAGNMLLKTTRMYASNLNNIKVFSRNWEKLKLAK